MPSVMTEPPARWLAVLGAFPPLRLGCVEAGIVTVRCSFGGESVSVRLGRQEPINESILCPPESSRVVPRLDRNVGHKALLQPRVFAAGTPIEAPDSVEIGAHDHSQITTCLSLHRLAEAERTIAERDLVTYGPPQAPLGPRSPPATPRLALKRQRRWKALRLT